MRSCSDRLIWQTWSILLPWIKSKSLRLAEAKTDPKFTGILLIKAPSMRTSRLPNCHPRTPSNITETSWRTIKASWIRGCHSLSSNHREESLWISRKHPSEIKGRNTAHEIGYNIIHRWINMYFTHRHLLKERSLNQQVWLVNIWTQITRTKLIRTVKRVHESKDVSQVSKRFGM